MPPKYAVFTSTPCTGGTTVPANALGTGTPDGTKFLRDDGTWQVPPGGGGPHASSHVTGGNDVLADAVASGASGLLSGSDKAKLDAIASGAEVNVNADWTAGSGDAQILNKPTLLTALDCWPVGSVYIAVDATDPATRFGGGTWVPFAAGRVLVGLDAGQTEFDVAEETGGAKTHTLTTAEIPSHTHVVTSQTATTGSATSYEHGTLDTSSAEAEATEVTGSTGGGGAHNNLQPYIVVRMWKRTA